MAIEYEFCSADPRTPDELLRAAGIKTLSGLSVYAGSALPSSAEAIRRTYGFSPKMSIVLRVDPSAYDSKKGYVGNLALVPAVMAMLEVAQGDALLLFNYEKPMLMRRCGKLLLCRDGGWWQNPALLEAVQGPYEMDSLPSL